MKKWWFLNTGLHNGAENMAIDDVLATRVVQSDNVPIFRIFGWQPFTISLGYGQNPYDLNLEKCKQEA